MLTFFRCALVVCTLLACAGNVGAAPLLTNNAPTITVGPSSVTYHKDLTWWKGYSPTGADILYSGDSGTWTFDTSGVPAAYTLADVTIRMVLDDHYAQLGSYTGAILFNGVLAYAGPLQPPLVHGAPYGGIFLNWSNIPFPNVPALVNPFVVRIDNTSALNRTDWIAIDYIDVTLHAVPEPASLLLLGIGLIGVHRLARRR